MSPYAMGALLQTGTTPNLDTLRGTTPQAPNLYTQGSLPPASYLDPISVNPPDLSNAAFYFTQLTQPNNPSGPIGALPMQIECVPPN